MFMDREALIHFVGGATGGTAATAITCPLEVIKTRMQSSKGININGSGPSTSQGQGSSQRRGAPPPGPPRVMKSSTSAPYKHFLGSDLRGHLAMQSLRGRVANELAVNPFSMSMLRFVQSQASVEAPRRRGNIFQYFRYIVQTEGVPALYKGLVPNLIGVAPAKAVYFYSYSTSKRFWNESDIFLPNSAIVHMVSAGSAGFISASVVNPIWMVKTRLQLHQGRIGILEMMRRIYHREGIRGFYRGVTASYAGVSETMIQFVIYEQLRGMLLQNANSDDKRTMDFLNFMVAGGTAKFIACVIAYPHEVVRTRLREESSVKRGFFSTLFALYKEGGRAMYRGLSVQLLRTVPNTAITMGTYEVVVYMLHRI